MIAPITAIIPCYRCSDTIHRAVDSVARQTLRPAELILVDDGSNDDTLPTLQHLQSEYGKDWIKVIALENNSGVSVARNTAWNVASQEYIAFLDSDDAWHPDKIATQYSWMRNHPEVALSGHLNVVVKSDIELEPVNFPENINANFISKNKLLFFNYFYTSSTMLKRNLEPRFISSLRYCQDYFLWLEIVLGGSQGVVLDFPGSYSFKAPFGESGLTKNLLNLKKDMSEIYRRLWQIGYINFTEWIILSLWSLVKHYRRVYICLSR